MRKNKIKDIINTIFSSLNKNKALNIEVVSYLFFGTLTTVIGLFIYWALIYFGFGVVISNTASHTFAILFAFITNKMWVFKSLNFSFLNIAKEFIFFVVGRTIIYVVDTFLLILMVYVLGYNPYISRIISMGLIVISNYFLSKLIVFPKMRNKCEDDKHE